MKTKILKHRVPQRILIGMLLVLFCFTSKAQTWENVHFNVDWQMNVPLNSNFDDKFSGFIDNRPATISVPTTLRNICILQVTG